MSGTPKIHTITIDIEDYGDEICVVFPDESHLPEWVQDASNDCSRIIYAAWHEHVGAHV